MIESKWATRFIQASMVQGLIAVVLTAVIALDLLTPSISRVIAGGGAGTWFFVGYSMFILVGVLGVALTALFYFYLESILGRVYKGMAKGLNKSSRSDGISNFKFTSFTALLYSSSLLPCSVIVARSTASNPASFNS